VGKKCEKPPMMLAAAENIKDFGLGKAEHFLLAESIFDWEGDRIGGSFPPIPLSDNEWLLAYHGKHFPGCGYTQSFMILKHDGSGFPQVAHRCSERLMYAERSWEMPDIYNCPCLFSTAGIVVGDTLIISYGAADQKVGISKVNFLDLVAYIRLFDKNGNRL
jgi:predicted GH43/DUF377 family glycosyl hydrolase